MGKTINNISCLLLFLTVISGIILSSPITFADDPLSSTVSANAAVIVPAACTFVSVNDEPHSATIPAGTFRETIGYTTFTTTCNDANGYAVYAVGYTNNEYGNTKLLATIGGVLDPTKDIITGTSSSGTTSNWGMRLSQVSSPGTPPTIASDTNGSFGSMHIVPSTYTKIANYSSSVISGSSFKVTYDAFIAGSQPAGNYNGRVRYTMVHPQSETPPGSRTTAARTIQYYPNGGDVVGTMGTHSNVSNGASVTLYASNYSRSGYGFAGWSTTFDYSDPNGFYGPNELIIAPSDITTNGLSLYAHWVESTGNLQSWAGCSSLSNGSVIALTDQRDNETYAVAKLADGNCWMIENLRLNDTASHNLDGTLAQGYGTSASYGNFSGLAGPEGAWNNESTIANSLYSVNGSNNTVNIGSGDNPAYRFPRYTNDNTMSRATNTTNADENTYSYGNYYNWPAAIADTTPHTTGNSSVTSTSICPTGWHLPSGGSAYASSSSSGVNVTGNPSTYRETYNLGYTIMGSDKTAYESSVSQPIGIARYATNVTNTDGDTAVRAFRKYPNNFVYSGRIMNGVIEKRGSSVYSYTSQYWTSTSVGTSYAFATAIDANYVYPGTAQPFKDQGSTVRCMINGT